MKKILLLGAALIGLSSISSAQVVDGASYRDTADIKCVNKWLWSRNHNKAGFEGLEFIANAGTRARTAALDPAREKVYVAWNPQFTEINGTDTTTTEFGRICTFDLSTGAYEGYVQLTENGTPITGTLTVQQIGVDDFGNLWFSGVNFGPTQEKPIKIYVVDNIETGECRQVGQWALPAEEESEAGRVDYCDVVGDITGQEANAVMMAAVGVFGSDNVNGLYRWELPQGETEWVANEEDFAGYVSTRDLVETYPEGTVSWGTSAAVVKIVKEDESDFSGKHFYVDGFTTPPALYNTSLEMVESFASAPDLTPSSVCNGVEEFTLGEKRFIAYAENQYDKDPGCRINICELGEGRSFEGMKKYWSVPDAGLGQLSDGGNRIHSIATQKVIDANGKEGVYLLTYKCYNGIGLYLIAEDGFIESSSSAPSTTKATSVTLSNTALNMTPGATSQLTATVLPENATNKAVTWTSSNTSVATVNATGIVTAVANGSATITATTTDGTNLSASCSVSVTTPTTTPGYSFEMSCDDVFANTTINLPVAMNNIGDITAFQCDIYLPENIAIGTNSNGRYNITLSERAAESHSIMTQAQADGAVRVMAYSTYNELFSGNSGTLFNIPLVIGDIEGNFSVYIKNISLSDANANEIFVNDAVLEIEVTKYRKGDANGDGRISVVDLTATAQYILGIIPANFAFSAADTNDDERIAINDLVAIANLVMSETANTSSVNAVNFPGTSLSTKATTKNTVVTTSDAKISIDDFEILQGEEKVITVNLDNAMSIVGYQCDIVLPDGLEFVLNKAGRVTATLNTERCYDHTLMTNILADGSCRMLCYSNYSTAIDGNSGAIFTFKVKAKENATMGATSISIKNAELSDANAQSIFPSVNDVTVNIKGNTGVSNITATGITVKTNGNDIIIISDNENIAVNIYNANGALIYSGDDNVITVPTHGVYIVKVNNQIFKVVI